uniref:Putative secreted protein n=1 Tax=Anopheles darlingi TaxID=43151 RepID=A0A2M4D5B5_ANODA
MDIVCFAQIGHIIVVTVVQIIWFGLWSSPFPHFDRGQFQHTLARCVNIECNGSRYMQLGCIITTAC